MKSVLRLIVALAGILFLVTGLRWLVDPSTAAAQLGMPLLNGLGRSSQIGDLSSFFLALGMLILLAVVTTRRVWYYSPIVLLGFATLGRLLAWLIHDATLAIELIAVELVTAGLLVLGSRVLTERE